ncbi:MAG: hypothetical protein PVJ67_00625 [Candidatus Pacearchaeota archaeon]|jgi:hypothetical protein
MYPIEKLVLSMKLKSVAQGLSNLINSRELTKENSENFSWAKKLIAQMDFHSEKYATEETRELSITATELRPNFISQLSKYGLTYEELDKTLNPNYKFLPTLNSAYRIFNKISSEVHNEIPMGNI